MSATCHILSRVLTRKSFLRRPGHIRGSNKMLKTYAAPRAKGTQRGVRTWRDLNFICVTELIVPLATDVHCKECQDSKRRNANLGGAVSYTPRFLQSTVLN